MKPFSHLWLSLLYFFSKKELTPLLKASHHLKSFQERSHWLQRMVRWISWNQRPRKEFDDPTLPAQAARMGFLIQVLERHPEDRKAVGIQLWALLSESSSQQLFSESGLSRERGFFTELASRVWQRLLPASVTENDLAQLFNLCFGSERSAAWIEKIPTEQMEYFIRMIRESAIDPGKSCPGLVESISEALLILGANVASVGVSRHVLIRSPKRTAHDSAFLRFNRSVMNFSDYLRRFEPSQREVLTQEAESSAEACRQSIACVFQQLETAGVSVHLVYDLENLQSWIKRALTLVRLSVQGSEHAALVTQFMTDLAREGIAKQSVMQLIRENIHILSRKIVERTGVSGEHYITKGLADYTKMLYQAMGGGLLTAFTTVGKYYVSVQHFPLFFDGFFAGLNYATSFVVIQFLHFTLATKQPSMTAPNLAGKLLQFQDKEEATPFIEEVARIARSQWISILGNVCAVVPMTFFIDKIFQLKVGRPIFTADYAAHALHSLDPVHSFTLPFAIFTGIILWTSSICAGWFENWIVYENIPEAIGASRRLQMFVGKRGATKVGQWFLKQSAGLGGNISLGFLLAYAGVFSKFFGLQLEVRHVTLSAGTLAFAVSSLLTKPGFDFSILVWPMVGIIGIGFFNVTTSFLLALNVAARARNVRKGTLRYLLTRVCFSFLKSPWQFFYPPKQAR